MAREGQGPEITRADNAKEQPDVSAESAGQGGTKESQRAALLQRLGEAYLRAPERYPTANVLAHSEVVPDTYILKRGDFKTKGEKVEPGFPGALNPGPPINEPADVLFVPQRRKALALWLTSPDQPLLGRVFTEDEDTNAHRVAVISHGLWQRRFGGAADVVGRTISLDDTPYEVIGVMPRHFYFMPSRDIDVWLPASFPPWMRRSFNWHDAQIVARLRPGVTLQHARQSLSQLSLQLTAKVFPGPHSVVITPMRDEIAGSTRTALILLLSASVAFLLIACVNLTNLLLARGIGRGREVAVRAALVRPRSRKRNPWLAQPSPRGHKNGQRGSPARHSFKTSSKDAI